MLRFLVIIALSFVAGCSSPPPAPLPVVPKNLQAELTRMLEVCRGVRSAHALAARGGNSLTSHMRAVEDAYNEVAAAFDSGIAILATNVVGKVDQKGMNDVVEAMRVAIDGPLQDFGEAKKALEAAAPGEFVPQAAPDVGVVVLLATAVGEVVKLYENWTTAAAKAESDRRRQHAEDLSKAIGKLKAPNFDELVQSGGNPTR